MGPSAVTLAMSESDQTFPLTRSLSLSLSLRSYCFSLEMHYGDSIFPALFSFFSFLSCRLSFSLSSSHGASVCLSVVFLLQSRLLPSVAAQDDSTSSYRWRRRRRNFALHAHVEIFNFCTLLHLLLPDLDSVVPLCFLEISSLYEQM